MDQINLFKVRKKWFLFLYFYGTKKYFDIFWFHDQVSRVLNLSH